MKQINSTSNGQIFICPHKKIIHLEFGNMLLKFSIDEFESFKEYVNSIDSKFYLAKNQQSQNRRKLLLHAGSNNSFLAFNENEFIELKLLLSSKRNFSIIKHSQLLTNNINLN